MVPNIVAPGRDTEQKGGAIIGYIILLEVRRVISPQL
jgi:hypothetical protein